MSFKALLKSRPIVGAFMIACIYHLLVVTLGTIFFTTLPFIDVQVGTWLLLIPAVALLTPGVLLLQVLQVEHSSGISLMLNFIIVVGISYLGIKLFLMLSKDGLTKKGKKGTEYTEI